MSAGGTGPAGRLAEAFIASKLTPLFIAASLALGASSALRLPREEEPQIDVPMFDIIVPFPGAGPREVEERLLAVGERKLWEIPGVEYIYSTAEPDGALFIVRFEVGTDPEEAMTRVYTKTFAHRDLLPPGAGEPLIKPRSIDDVPILALNITGEGLSPRELRRAAGFLRQEAAAIPEVSETELIGGRRRQLLVHFDPEALARLRLSPLELAELVRGSNRRLPAGRVSRGPEALTVETDALIRSAEELGTVVVGVSGGRPVRLSEVARVVDGPDEDEDAVWTSEPGSPPRPAVTLAVAKRRGANATRVSREVLARVERVRPALPPGLRVEPVRDYGRTAKEKSDELLFHMALATLSVTLIVALALGWREGLVVLVAVPVTLGLTLLVYDLWGYTLNRITLFALIFSIGILVDDAIVVAENIHRHFMMQDGRPLERLAVEAVAEVGNPTLLATWTVVAAILPMAFVGGLMGPYMRPIPVGASFAMLFSAAVAFVISPWVFARILRLWPPRRCPAARETALDRLYRRAMGWLLASRRNGALFLAGTAVLLLLSCALLPLGLVTVKMLPFDDKDELEVVLNMPESSSLEATSAALRELAAEVEKVPEARRVTAYAGAAPPYTFNGLVRHYFMRRRPHQGSLLVNLSPRHDRKRQSHAIAKELRPALHAVAKRRGARLQVAEVPPGPPVLSTIVLEVYDPDRERQLEAARRLKALLESSEGITDVDTYVPDPEPLERLLVDREKATLNGIPPAAVAGTLAAALGGLSVDLAHLEGEPEPVEIRLRLPPSLRRDADAARRIRLPSRSGTLVPLSALTHPERRVREGPIHHKNLLRAAYVIADVSGRRESPVYALLALRGPVAELGRELGVEFKTYYASQPRGSLETAVKWDGEWQITYEVFRDLGLAFAAVLLLIYGLVVGWFGSLSVPLVIMAPIPLTLAGILPAHAALGAFFTATSMIGFIAGAGIVVRNSIILVDFIELRRSQGLPLREAVVDAGAVRFRPMLLTAAAVVAGAGVILFDPIFQGLAVSLMAGEVASTLLSRVAVPVLYYWQARGEG